MSSTVYCPHIFVSATFEGGSNHQGLQLVMSGFMSWAGSSICLWIRSNIAESYLI